MVYDKIRKLSDIEKNNIIKKITDVLVKHEEIIFAYLHGSFNTSVSFRDIDIAVYINRRYESVLEYELNLEVELIKVTEGCPVDVRVLNVSSSSFNYHVIKDGTILIARDDNARADFQEKTLIDYFDFEPFRRNYLKVSLDFEV